MPVLSHNGSPQSITCFHFLLRNSSHWLLDQRLFTPSSDLGKRTFERKKNKVQHNSSLTWISGERKININNTQKPASHSLQEKETKISQAHNSSLTQPSRERKTQMSTAHNSSLTQPSRERNINVSSTQQQRHTGFKRKGNTNVNSTK